VITGPVGTGKSSLLELIRYALGDDAVLSKAVLAAVQRVVLRIRLGNDTWVLERRIKSGLVQLLDTNGRALRTFATTGAARHPSISGFLLERLGLPEVRIVRSRTKPTGETTPLTFNDYYPYSYVSQSEIDRSVVYHLDPFREPKRRAVFEVLFGLAEDELHQLQTQLGELNDRLKAGRAREQAVAAFLREGEEGSEESLMVELARLSESLIAAQGRLNDLRASSRTATLQAGPRRERLVLLIGQLANIAERERTLQNEIEERTRLLAQIQLDLQRLDRSEVAGDVFEAVSFRRCPRCMQSIEPGRLAIGHCYVCGQPDPVRPADGDREGFFDNERKRLRALQTEIAGLVEESQAGLGSIADDRRVLEISVTATEADIEQGTRAYVSPLFEAIADSSALIARVEARRKAVQRALDYWLRQRKLSAEVRETEQQLTSVRQKLEEARNRVEARRHRVTEISNLFDEIVQFLRVPWYQSARIDARSYLPVVNETSFVGLSSGGIKTIVNVAYHISLLTYALRTQMTLVPYLLILDSPRKNLGSGPDDRGLAERMYRRFRSLADTYGENYQLIIADNDVQHLDVSFATITALSYAKPLIPDLEHPGPTVESIS